MRHLSAMTTTAFCADIASRSDAYGAADPFPHIVIEEFLPRDVYERLSAAFPAPSADIWYKYKGSRQNKKLQSQYHDRLCDGYRTLIDNLNSPAFLRQLEALTGIDALIADPELTGGGLHQTLPGGHLAVHVDYNRHRTTGQRRRLNAILYFNDTWEDAWGGHLEFWDRDMGKCVQRIAPIGNRLVVFSTTDSSWHGHPEPLACPPGITRRSVALYYYTDAVADSGAEIDDTLLHERPGEEFKPTLRERAGALLRAIR